MRAVTWLLMWLNRSITTLNATLQFLVIYRFLKALQAKTLSLSLSLFETLLRLSQWETALGNRVTSQSPQAPSMTHHLRNNFQSVPKDGLAQIHKFKIKLNLKKKKNTLSSSFTLVLHVVYTYFENLTTELHILYILNIYVKFLSNRMLITI